MKARWFIGAGVAGLGAIAAGATDLPGGPPGPSRPVVSSVAAAGAEALQMELLQRAIDPVACAGIVDALTDAHTLDRLDDPAVRVEQSPVEWRLYRVVAALGSNPSPDAASAFDRLCGSKAYRSDPGRAEILLRALGARGPFGAAAEALVREEVAPDNVNLQVAVVSLWRNRSDPALRLLEEILADPRHDDAFVAVWMRMGFVPWRGEVPVVRLADRLLAAGRLEPARRTLLVESLFDFRPDEWFPGYESAVRPPTLEETSPAASAVLSALARRLLEEGGLPPSLEEVVRRAAAVGERR